MIRNALMFLILLLAVGSAQAEPSPIVGVDHIPIVVANLEKAEADFRAMGFIIKPGRFHENGIRNAHVKFRNHTGLELITAPAPTDALATEYYEKAQKGDGPVYFALTAMDLKSFRSQLMAVGAKPEPEGLVSFPANDALHSLFFGNRGVSPTDRPEYYAHPNSAIRYSGIWLSNGTAIANLLGKLGIKTRSIQACGPTEGKVQIASLPDGEVTISAGDGSASVFAATVEVNSLDDVRRELRQGAVAPAAYACDPHSVWVSPRHSHGIWLRFREIAHR